MKVLVTGGTGFVGSELLRQLHEVGHQVRVLTRHPQPASVRETLTRYQAEQTVGDILDREALRQFSAGGDAMIHLVGIISEIGRNTFENIHARGTANVVDAAKAAGIKRFIHMSALGTRPGAESRYHKSKWAGEQAVHESGLEYTIFRPSIIYGADDAFTTMFARLARRSPVLPVIGPGEGTFQPIPVECVAKCFVSCLDEPRSIDQTFDICGPDLLTMNEVLDAICQAMGRRRLKLHVPLPLARAVAAILELIYPRLLRKPAPLSRDQILMLQEKTRGDVLPSVEMFRLLPPKFVDGLREYIEGSGFLAT